MRPDAKELALAFNEELGVTLERTQLLADRLSSALDATHGGFLFFADLPLRTRAIASDQIVGASRTIEVNLVEARLHEDNRARLAAEGFGFPRSIQDHERRIRTSGETVAFFRAIGSTLDCMAAVVTGLLRIPVSIRRASFAGVMRLEPHTAPSPSMREMWMRFLELLAVETSEPNDWLAWTLEMRHALMHRARLLDVLVARDLELPRMALPPHIMQQVATERIRADHHFRRKPWLPDMEHLTNPIGINEAILTESVTTTVRGITTATAALVEAISGWLLDEWSCVESLRPSPAEAWKPERTRPIKFAGFAPSERLQSVDTMVVNPADVERVRLAAQLRESTDDYEEFI